MGRGGATAAAGLCVFGSAGGVGINMCVRADGVGCSRTALHIADDQVSAECLSTTSAAAAAPSFEPLVIEHHVYVLPGAFCQ
jgi:hypothetical protein